MLKHGTASVAESMDPDEQTSRQRVVHNLSRRARDLGYDLVATREAVTQAGLGEARDSRIVPGKALVVKVLEQRNGILVDASAQMPCGIPYPLLFSPFIFAVDQTPAAVPPQ